MKSNKKAYKKITLIFILIDFYLSSYKVLLLMQFYNLKKIDIIENHIIMLSLLETEGVKSKIRTVWTLALPITPTYHSSFFLIILSD